MIVDRNLQFLQHCENEDLHVLCDILLYDNRGKIRYSGNISNRECFLKNYPDNMQVMWKELAKELQNFGGNSILKFLRDGQGSSYEKILRDVCNIEHKLLIKIFAKAIGKLSGKEIRSIMDECKMKGYDYTKQGLLAALLDLQVINHIGFVIVIQTVIRMTTQILVGRGVAFVGLKIISRSIGALCGPIGWLLLAGCSIWHIGGPAYHVTIPAVIQVAYMRAKYLSNSNSK